MPAQRWRSSRAWTTLSKRVVSEEPLCWLRLPGCTTLSTTADHILIADKYPSLRMVRSNLRGACLHCNSARGSRAVEDLPHPAAAAALAFFD